MASWEQFYNLKLRNFQANDPLGGDAWKVKIVDGVAISASENLTQINGQPVNVGTGVAGTGTLRVSVSSDSSIILAAGSNTIGTVITKGDVADNAVLINLNPNLIGGKAVNTATYAPAYTAGDSATLAVDKDNGGLLVNQANLNYAQDSVTIGNGANQVLTSSSVTDDNTITAGATAIGMYTSSDFTGNINGVARLASTFYGFEAVIGKTLPAITYTTTTGSIIIDKLV